MSSAQILFGSVMHRRLRPAQHRFTYPVFALLLPATADEPAKGDVAAVVKGNTEFAVNLYGKLGVNKRWDAVIKAEALGVLPRR